MAKIDGATLIARSLKQQGVDYMFGVVGFPVGPIAAAAQKEGIAYIGMRNEQAASYAAQAAATYRRPGACLVVSGPGVVHGLAGLANAQQNCWPMILIGGASDLSQNGMGAFQEERQVRSPRRSASSPRGRHVTASPSTSKGGPTRSTAGPAPATSTCPTTSSAARTERTSTCRRKSPNRRGSALQEDIEKALEHARRAERRCSSSARGWRGRAPRTKCALSSRRTQMPFLASPMGKGVVPDDHPLSVGAAAARRCRTPTSSS